MSVILVEDMGSWELKYGAWDAGAGVVGVDAGMTSPVSPYLFYSLRNESKLHITETHLYLK